MASTNVQAFSGDVEIAGNLSVPSGITGVVSSAAALETARAINGVPFDGTGDITVEPYISNSDTGDTDCFIVFTLDSTNGYKRLYEDSGLVYDNTANQLKLGSMQIDDYIYHKGDTDTLIGFSTNDTIIMQTSGTPRLTISNTGQVDIPGNLNYGTITQFRGSYKGQFNFSGDGYLAGFRMETGCIGLQMRMIARPFSRATLSLAGSRDHLGNYNNIQSFGSYGHNWYGDLTFYQNNIIAPDTDISVDGIMMILDISATGKENTYIGTTNSSRYHYVYVATSHDNFNGTHTYRGHGYFRHQNNFLNEIKLNMSVGSVKGEYQIIKYY